MVAHNARPYLEAAIRAVLDQDGIDLELIVVDDGSTDCSGDVARAIGDPRLRLIRNDRPRGEAHSHNLVASQSRAPFLAHADPRGLVLPGGLAALVEAARPSPAVGLVHGYSFRIDDNGRITREAFRARRHWLRRHRTADLDVREALLRSEQALDGFRLYRHEVLRAVGGLDEREGVDAAFLLALRIADRAEVALVPCFVHAHRLVDPAAVTQTHGGALGRWWRRLLLSRRARESGRVRFLREPRYHPERLFILAALNDLGIVKIWDRLRRGWLRKRLAEAVNRAAEGVYAVAAPRLGWWPLVPPRRGSARTERADSRAERVAYYTWHFPIAGQTYIHRELAALKREGVSVAIVADAPEDLELVDRDALALLPDAHFLEPIEPGRLQRYQRLFLRERPLRYLALFVYVLSRRWGRFKSLRDDLSLFRRGVLLAGVLRERGGVRLVHSPLADRSAFVALVASHLLGVPYSVHARAGDIHRHTSRPGLVQRLEQAEFVVTNCQFNVAHLRVLLGPDGPPLHLVYDGVDLECLTPEPGAAREAGPIRLLCVARLIEPKGLEYLLRACQLLEQRGEAFVCDVVGGPDQPGYSSYWVRLKQEHRRLGLERRVRFHGAQPFDAVLEWYRRADVFVLPCVVAANGSQDITPNSLIEAMAMRLPVVSTTITALPEIVNDGVHGLLVPPGDAEALADALARLIHDAELRCRLGANARARVQERFDVRRNVAEFATLFSALPRGGTGR